MGNGLPPVLRAAIGEMTAGLRLSDVSAHAERLSKAYRSGAGSGLVRQREDIAAYLVARLPATYAAVSAALEELERLAPEFAPASMIDIGCGPGTALLAALSRFPGLATLAGIDVNRRFLDTAQELTREVNGDAPRTIRFDKGDFLAAGQSVDASDLVVMAYALVEAPAHKVAAIALRLFAATKQALVLVEPGSTAGFERIRTARAALVEAGAHILAPCTHAAACPMLSPDWCHFSVRLARSREHQRAKGATVPFEDEKFSYLIATRAPLEHPTQARIVGPALPSKGDITFKICNRSGISTRQILRRDSAFKPLRKRDWGDLLPEL